MYLNAKNFTENFLDIPELYCVLLIMAHFSFLFCMAYNFWQIADQLCGMGTLVGYICGWPTI